ncbi:Cytochrome c-551 precursor [Roseovarius litorisediminis]|uniref:Cytochrome c-551 n=1 Tax=Roseovarius litorisediminis TaxID=1312363 RepID=A0A1Y5SQX7_9RHOB|nr:cytochrome c [Roseovarius litorisediminis]SLN44556.1 Cytochrome c-551 precursor [Roseovarius litorisediminis]
MNRVTLILAFTALPAVAGEPDALALERLVRQDCGSCHGLTLKGGLGPDIRPAALSHYKTDTLKAVILDGIPGTPMPPWRPLLSDSEAGWIAEYLLTGESP